MLTPNKPLTPGTIIKTNPVLRPLPAPPAIGQHLILSGHYTMKAGDDVEWCEGAIVTFEVNTTIEVPETAKLTIRTRMNCDLRQVLFTGKGKVLLHPSACPKVSVAWFGALPNRENCADKFKKAIKAGQLVKHFYIPAGTALLDTEGQPTNNYYYRIDETVHWMYEPDWIPPGGPTASGTSIVVEGEGCSDGERSRKLTRIIYFGTSGPAFNFRGLSRSRVFGFELMGLNFRPQYYCDRGDPGRIRIGTDGKVTFDPVGEPAEGEEKGKSITLRSGVHVEELEKQLRLTSPELWLDKNWIGKDKDKVDDPADPGGIQVSHAGIAVDYVDQGNPLKCSADTTFFDIKISNFVCCISISPNKLDQQGDTLHFNNVKLQNFVYGVSIGQDQARSCSFTNMHMAYGYCAFSNNHAGFGGKDSSLFNIQGGQFCRIFKLFNLQSANGGQASFNGLYAEACGIIGSLVGLGTNSNPIAFTGCDFGMADDGYWPDRALRNTSFVTPYSCIEGGANVSFTGCRFNTRKEYFSITTSRFGRTSFRNCSFNNSAVDTREKQLVVSKLPSQLYQGIKYILLPNNPSEMLSVSFEDCTTMNEITVGCEDNSEWPKQTKVMFDTAFDDCPIVNATSIPKVYVRPCIRGVRSVRQLGVGDFVFNDMQVVGCELREERQLRIPPEEVTETINVEYIYEQNKIQKWGFEKKQFKVTKAQLEAMGNSLADLENHWFVGDYCYAYLSPRTFPLTDWNGNAGGSSVPALVVRKVETDYVLFEKLAPEVVEKQDPNPNEPDPNKQPGPYWGAPSSAHRQWIATEQICATFDGTTTARKCYNARLLSIGDWCQIGYGPKRAFARVKSVDVKSPDVADHTVTFTPFTGAPKPTGRLEIYSVRVTRWQAETNALEACRPLLAPSAPIGNPVQLKPTK